MRRPSQAGSQIIRVALADANLVACDLMSARLRKIFDVVGYATCAIPTCLNF